MGTLTKSPDRSLKKLSQLVGMFPPDLNITPRAQELLEEFHNLHGIPNEAERDLLAIALQVNHDTLREWCKHNLNASR